VVVVHLREKWATERWNTIEVGLGKSEVLDRAGVPSLERVYDPQLDAEMDVGADSVLVYHLDVPFGYGPTWKVYLRSGRVFRVRKDPGR
jgi:hypothetical protein